MGIRDRLRSSSSAVYYMVKFPSSKEIRSQSSSDSGPKVRPDPVSVEPNKLKAWLQKRFNKVYVGSEAHKDAEFARSISSELDKWKPLLYVLIALTIIGLGVGIGGAINKGNNQNQQQQRFGTAGQNWT